MILDNEYVEPLPFDSYSALYNRCGRGIGGLKRFSFGGYYGCCACIASTGIAIFPLCAALKSKVGFTLNGFLPGKLTEKTPAGKRIQIDFESSYPAFPCLRIKLSLDNPERFTLRLRVPTYFCCADISYQRQISSVQYRILHFRSVLAGWRYNRIAWSLWIAEI